MRDRPHSPSHPMTPEEKRLAQRVRDGRAAPVDALLNAHPLLASVRYDDGRSWLHLAAEHGHLSVAQTLLDHEPDLLRARDDEGHTPALIAVNHGFREVLDLFIARGLDPRDSCTVRRTHWVSGYTLLHAAAAHAMPRMVQHLVGLGVPVDAQDSRGMTPLWLASGPTFKYQDSTGERPHPGDVVRTLLAAGANAFEGDKRAPSIRLEALPAADLRRAAFDQKLQEIALRETLDALDVAANGADPSPIPPRSRFRL